MVFTDESNINAQRFSALSAVSMPLEHLPRIKDGLAQIVREAGVSEFAWESLRNFKYYECADKIMKFIVLHVQRCNIRIDTLLWDAHDSRHAVIGRDDSANYERMFYHLLKNVMERRPAGSKWHIFPDEKGGIDWETTKACLKNTGKRKRFANQLFQARVFFTIEAFQEKSSHEEPLIQAADLFSGLMVFSREKYQEYCIWKQQNQNQLSLFPAEDNKKLSNKERFRSKLLDNFYLMCRTHKLGVSLHEEQCLRTFNPRYPINFWPYTPQGDYDKAPTRSQRT